MISDCQELLRLFGIPFIIAAGEAEAQCAWMQDNGVVDVIITDDSDVLLFGDSCRVYRNVFNKNKYIESYSSDRIFESLNFTREKFVQLAMLVGSDYSEGIKGIGAVNGIEILERFEGAGISGLQQFKEFWNGVQQNESKSAPRGFAKMKKLCRRIEISDKFPDQRIYDAYFNPQINHVSRKDFFWEGPDFHSIRRYLSDRLDWGKQKLDNILGPLEREVQKRKEGGSEQRQSLLDSFFLKTVKSPTNQRVAKVVESWKVKQVTESDVKIDSKHIKLPKRNKRR